MLLSLNIFFRFCFRHLQTYSSIIQEHTYAYSEPCISLVCSEPWHILITKHVQAPRYINNTILNIFTKAPSWTLIEFWMRFSLQDATLYSVLTLHFRHIRASSRFIQPYLFLLRHIKNPSILRNFLLQRYSTHGLFSHIQSRWHIQLVSDTKLELM